MSNATEIILPALGDSDRITGEIVRLAAVGEALSAGDIFMEVETDKVVVEIPAPSSGVIDSLSVSLGQQVCGGDVVGYLRSEGDAANEETPAADTAEFAERIENDEEAPAPQTPASANPPAMESTAPAAEQAAVAGMQESEPAGELNVYPAGPAARQLARTLGVDLGDITGTGARGRITKEDVIRHTRQRLRQPEAQGVSAAPALPDISRFGEVASRSLSGIGKATARNMTIAWQQIPHAWVQEEIDITELEALRKRFKNESKDNPPLTVTALLCKIVALALTRFPDFNSVLDAQAQQVLQRKYVNIGVAVDTPRGLVVPGIRDAEKKSALSIAIELKQISERAVAGKLTAAELEGNGFTISNLGGLGVSGLFPVVNWPEVAILGVASSRSRCVMDDGAVSNRLIMPVTLGFDHRVINGADAARFLGFLRQCLEEPGLALIVA
ncbi:2-oxo acid dehydrogenase subunit E2 [Spongiibacter taiwanensis]|uniref:dihydrolipoamide acetyltransferase family protein n=1 Tax=Spongiibacter taiwanensis TaxID=1748242 RepID=UPI0020363D69|nr:dihydrolipoamide acetyltransferase family protein [Spongiibacter taiwanensis]USA42654.1 2-oxo acid dehydrogenase subunit E2 [Spongiibacter taiwanensis]